MPTFRVELHTPAITSYHFTCSRPVQALSTASYEQFGERLHFRKISEPGVFPIRYAVHSYGTHIACATVHKVKDLPQGSA